ncbi:MAG: hypothetical protein QM647_08885 [Asticcacaulis sp.]|uniref:hypothetical protein n=1 Tax=Asticcacaulis sp. TaxID=1872648 RepID=UPI0039E2BB02
MGLMMRQRALLGLSLAAVYGGVLFAPVSAAAQTVSREKTEAAYQLALKCFVANGRAYSYWSDAHDEKRATYFDIRAKHSWDVALRLSKQLGISSDRFEADVDKTTDRELPLMVRNTEYFTQVANECKAYGLM